jgi:hypothetical protein
MYIRQTPPSYENIQTSELFSLKVVNYEAWGAEDGRRAEKQRDQEPELE